MNKKELFNTCEHIILGTDGTNEDYVIALCKMRELISDYASEKEKYIFVLEDKLKNTHFDIINICEYIRTSVLNANILYNVQGCAGIYYFDELIDYVMRNYNSIDFKKKYKD